MEYTFIKENVATIILSADNDEEARNYLESIVKSTEGYFICSVDEELN